MLDLIAMQCTGSHYVFRGGFDDELIVTLDAQASYSMIEIHSVACDIDTKHR